jgi:hypothetical protein
VPRISMNNYVVVVTMSVDGDTSTFTTWKCNTIYWEKVTQLLDITDKIKSHSPIKKN